MDESTADQRRALADGALALLEHLYGRDTGAPIYTPTPPGLVDAMRAAPEEAAGDPAAVFARLQAAAECGWNKRHGGDLAYIPSGGLYSGAIAALLAAGMHAFTGAAYEAPALVGLEEGVLRWFADMLGLPAQAEGLLLSGGSLANQTAIVAARERGGGDPVRSRAYLSERAHHSLHKALHLSGIAPERICPIAGDAGGRIDVAALRARLQADRAAGLQPWLLVGTAGSTDTGSVDDLEALAALAAEHGLWLHVDAAYGGMFALTERGRTQLRGLGAADSVTVDAHKGLMLPYGVAALLVRAPGALQRAHRAHHAAGAYLRDVPQADHLPHYYERGPELTRPFRGLLVWLPLQLHGVAAFRAALDRCLDLAREAHDRLAALPGIELLHEPQLSIVAFRARAGDAATEALLAALNLSGVLHVSSTTLAGRSAIRLAFLHPRTSQAQIDAVLRVAAATLTR
jgi:aromatic-L-amino-acid decarboxylase